MTQDLDDTILKYKKFIALQGDKLDYVYNILKSFKKIFKKNENIDREYFKSYFKSIYYEIDLLQDILRICNEDLNYFLNSEKNVGCISFLKIRNLQFNLEYLSERKCNKCLEIIEFCISLTF